ncbi:MAG: sterol desaturase family protein [Myxococcota bacterium]
MNLIIPAIPLFFLLVGAEMVYAHRGGRRLHRLSDSVASLASGVLDQVGTALIAAFVTFTLYAWVHDTFAVARLDPSRAWVWVAAFVGADFLFYWWHRSTHRVGVLWAGHVVHHQSDEFNLTTALRQNWVAGLSAVPFYLPLAVLGVPLAVFVPMKSLMVIYQFWIHTRVIGKLPRPVEWVMNTPSHHRVHHAINPVYVDKNYAGTFIVWDRLFGTFAPEAEAPEYGVLKPLRSWNPAWAMVEPWVHLARTSASAPRRQDRLYAWIAPPEWAADPNRRADLQALYHQAKAERYAVSMGPKTTAYVLIQFGITVAAASAFLFLGKQLPLGWKAVFGALVFFSLASLGTLADRRPAAWRIEVLRLACVVAAGVGWVLG